MSKNVPKIRFEGFSREWNSTILGELVNISSASRVHKNEWRNEGVPFFRSSDVISKYMKKFNTPVFISDSLYQNLSKKSGKMEIGDLLVTGGGTIGIPYLIENAEPLYFKDADLIWFKSSDIIDGRFLFNYFVSPQTRRYISSITHIGTISHYTIEQGKNTPITLPDTEEQQKIGSFFKQLDDTIALQQQLVEQQQQYKKAMLQKMFPQKDERVPKVRFDGFIGDWAEKTLVEISKIIMGQSPNGKNYTDNPEDYILVQGNADMKNGRVVPRIWTTQITKTASPGDLILSVRAPVGEIGITDYDVVLGRGVAGIKANQFIYQTLLRMKLFGLWKKLSTGSTFDSINSNDLKNIILLVPSLEEQHKIGTFFKQLDDTIAHHQKNHENYQQLKKALLQRMFV
ncbi:restriction endonuclease subunit S [Virgibacillus necropolis]|uniref:Restriction endonuclease subunit S n=1 Tax=Virgibacillus necropolis TaxID=163877 RepID=A0A221MFC5_9BACI|nr:restriction endonuclease subunit S [Virgibacillus necropolis]ASN06335.1 restriction endonuclease subunit S [Virgibacillus necropolis]